MDALVTPARRRAALRALPLLAAALLLAPAVEAQRRGWPDNRQPQPQVDAYPDESGPVGPPVAAGIVTVRLLPDVTRWVPGRTHLLGVSFRMTEGWHLYWRGQNDSGLPVALEPEPPEGFVTGEVRWPAPVRYLQPGDLVDHVYHDAVTLLLPVEVPEDAPEGERLTLRVAADWLVCAEACVPGAATADLTMSVSGPTELPRRSDDAERIDAARAAVPTALPPEVEVTADDGRVVIHAPGASRLAFYPRDDGLPIADVAGSCEVAGDRLVLAPDASLDLGDDPRLRGLLAIWTGPSPIGRDHAGPDEPPAGTSAEDRTRPSRVSRVDLPYPPDRDGAEPGSSRPDPASNDGADR